jgi:tRNA pseudouridine55 synthase
MSALERTAVGEFRVEDACDLNALSAESLPQILLSPLQAVNSLPRVQLSDPEVQLAINGLFVPSNSGSVVSGATGQEFAGIDSSGELVSILRRREDASLAPVLNFRKAAPR